MHETALGRLVPASESQTALEDAILSLLFDYRLHPQNPSNVPMKLSDIVRAVASESERAFVIAALDGLKERVTPLVEELAEFQGERMFRITGTGVGFVRNLPQGLASIS